MIISYKYIERLYILVFLIEHYCSGSAHSRLSYNETVQYFFLLPLSVICELRYCHVCCT
jgi:hypothetical protein